MSVVMAAVEINTVIRASGSIPGATGLGLRVGIGAGRSSRWSGEVGVKEASLRVVGTAGDRPGPGRPLAHRQSPR